MRAIIIRAYGGPEQLTLEERPDPTPKPGHVLIDVKAFGLNHAEIYFRKGAWGEVASISGIECVGRVVADPDGRFTEGAMVAALMGGMGRTINGSYAERTLVPATNVVALDSNLAWEDLAALPESYATAWTCLNRNLGLARGEVLLVRGATSALGQAAVNIAVQAGVTVMATTRRPDRIAALEGLGATPVLDAPDLSHRIRGQRRRGIDAVLDIVGTKTLLDSLAAVRAGGRVCMAGFLGGFEPISAFDPLRHLPSGVQLSFFASAFTFGNDDYPLSSIPLQAMVDRAACGIYKAKPAKVFDFAEIVAAHRLLENGRANGKIVVRV